MRASASPEAEVHALDLAAAQDAGEVLEGEGLLEDSLLDRQDLPAAPLPGGAPFEGGGDPEPVPVVARRVAAVALGEPGLREGHGAPRGDAQPVVDQ